jgi:ABC-2 type transport system ATP-binding protein
MARREFLRSLMQFVSDEGTSVVLSSHLVADLERTCDHLLVLAVGHVQLSGDVDDLLASHYRLVGPRTDERTLPAGVEVIEASHTDRQSTFIVRSDSPIYDPMLTVEELSLEDVVLAHMSRTPGTTAALPRHAASGSHRAVQGSRR